MAQRIVRGAALLVGLKRLLTTGASFTFAEYPYAGTVTCAGHATISTDLLPSSHGLVGNTWFDRDASALGAAPSPGIASTFPHRLNGAGGGPDATFYQQWQSSPLSDEYLARTALKAARAFTFDRAGGPNLLGISFSALDRVDHEFGPQSHEVQDVLIRLDRTLPRTDGRALSEALGAPAPSPPTH